MEGIEIIRPDNLETMSAQDRTACAEASVAGLMLELATVGFGGVEVLSGSIRAVGGILSAAQLSSDFDPPESDLERALHEAIRALERYGKLLEAQA